MAEKDNKQQLKELLKQMGIGFTNADEIIDRAKIPAKQSSDIK